MSGMIDASNPQIYRITKDNAREMARKSHEARQRKKAELEAQAAMGRKSTPQSERLANLITKLENLMEDTNDCDELQKLSAAHSRAFSAWQVLTGTPNVGTRKATKQRTNDSLPAPVAQPVTSPTA